MKLLMENWNKFINEELSTEGEEKVLSANDTYLAEVFETASDDRYEPGARDRDPKELPDWAEDLGLGQADVDYFSENDLEPFRGSDGGMWVRHLDTGEEMPYKLRGSVYSHAGMEPDYEPVPEW